MSDRKERKKRSAVRSFPKFSLEKALEVPLSLKEKNAGNSWDPASVSKAVGIGQKSTNFLYIINSAKEYGLIEGAARGNAVSLTPLGRSCVYPSSMDAEAEAKREAFFNVISFKNVLSYYKGNNLPDMEYLGNVLETKFNIEPEHHTDFVSLFNDNCRYLGIGKDYKPGTLLQVEGSNKSIEVISGATSTHVSSKNDAVSCFVIMPFLERDSSHPPGFFSEVLTSLIIPAAENNGYSVSTANRDGGSDIIQSTIINELLKADLVIADLTEHNPNVLFELGMRMAEDKPIALIRSSGTGKIFDVDNMLRVLDYNPCMWPSTVETDIPCLSKHFKASWENRDTDISYMKLLRQHATSQGVVV